MKSQVLQGAETTEIRAKIQNVPQRLDRFSPAEQTLSCSNISMQVLGGFMAVVGIAAVAIAFVTLNAATFGTVGLVVTGLGASSILGGIGFFVGRFL